MRGLKMTINIQHWDTFFTEEESSLLNKLDDYTWEFTGSSREEMLARTFWCKRLDDYRELHDCLNAKMSAHFNRPIKSLRLYANGQAHGQCGTLHSDFYDGMEKPVTVSDNYYSLVIYTHKEWLPIYGGHIIFVDDTKENVIASIFPKTNSAVLFNAALFHAGLEPTVFCKKQRESIAYKFQVL
jgi:hypothetical protein